MKTILGFCALALIMWPDISMAGHDTLDEYPIYGCTKVVGRNNVEECLPNKIRQMPHDLLRIACFVQSSKNPEDPGAPGYDLSTSDEFNMVVIFEQLSIEQMDRDGKPFIMTGSAFLNRRYSGAFPPSIAMKMTFRPGASTGRPLTPEQVEEILEMDPPPIDSGVVQMLTELYEDQRLADVNRDPLVLPNKIPPFSVIGNISRALDSFNFVDARRKGNFNLLLTLDKETSSIFVTFVIRPLSGDGDYYPFPVCSEPYAAMDDDE